MADNFNTLDRHASGTWTPTLVGGTDPGTYSIAAANTAQWWRDGNRVFVSASMTITVTGAGTGNAVFGGLPYRKAATQVFVGSVYTSGVDHTAGTISLAVHSIDVSIAGSTFGIYATTDNAAGVVLPVTAFASTDLVRVSFWYVTDE